MVVARAERKRKLQEVTRQGIREAVLRIMRRGGQVAITMENVAAEAGLAKGSLYLYFKNKEELLASVKEASLQPLDEDLFAIMDGDLPPDRKLHEVILRHLSYFDTHRDFFRVLLWDRHVAVMSSRRQPSARFRAYTIKLATVIEDGIAAGLFASIDPGRVAVLALESTIALAIMRLRGEATGPVEDDARLVATLILDGIAARPASRGGRT